MNQKTETPKVRKAVKDSKHLQSSLTDDRLIEFCCNLSSKSGKKKDRKRRDKSKSKKSNHGVSTDCQPRCFVCMPTDCTEGDGHSSKKESKSKVKYKGKKDWQGECLKIFKELQSCRKKSKKQTVSRGSDPEPCNEVYREIGFMSQDPCMDYYNNAQEPGEPWSQPGADWRNPWGNDYSGNTDWQQWQPQDPRAWSSPQTVVYSPNLSPSASSASSTTDIKTTEVDTAMLLAIARAAISLSMEHHKGAKQKGKHKNVSDDDDEESSFCDILESIFGQ